MSRTSKEIYRVWLKNLSEYDHAWTSDAAAEAGNTLLSYFAQIVTRSERFGFVDLSWNPIAGNVKDHELLVYVLPGRAASIVAQNTQERLGPTGTTFKTRTGVISEIYADALKGDAGCGRLVANVIFHHLMHNKLEPAIVRDIHTLGGGGLAVQSPLSSSHRPTPENFNLMARGLGRINPQYTTSLAG